MKDLFFPHLKTRSACRRRLTVITAGTFLLSCLSLPAALAQIGQSELIQPDNNGIPPEAYFSTQDAGQNIDPSQSQQTGQSDWIRPGAGSGNPANNYAPGGLGQSGWIQPGPNNQPYQQQPAQQPSAIGQSGWIQPGQQQPMQQNQGRPDFSSFDAQYGGNQLNGEVSRMQPQAPVQQGFMPTGSPDLMQDTRFDAIGQALNKAAQSGALPQSGATNGGGMFSQGNNQFSRPLLSRPAPVQRPGMMQSYPARMVGNSVNRAVNRSLNRAINQGLGRALNW